MTYFNGCDWSEFYFNIQSDMIKARYCILCWQIRCKLRHYCFALTSSHCTSWRERSWVLDQQASENTFVRFFLVHCKNQMVKLNPPMKQRSWGLFWKTMPSNPTVWYKRNTYLIRIFGIYRRMQPIKVDWARNFLKCTSFVSFEDKYLAVRTIKIIICCSVSGQASIC